MAIAWQRPKDPSEVVDYGHNWTLDLGDDTIATSTWTAIEAAGTAPVSNSFAGGVTRVFLSGGNDGTAALWLNRITTSGGRTLEEAFQLSIVDRATVAAVPTAAETLQADRAAIVAARRKFLSGEAVREVTRAGRKLVFQTTSLKDFDDALAAIDRNIDALAADDGRPRFHALSVRFRA